MAILYKNLLCRILLFTLHSQLKSERNYDEVIYTSPDGEKFNQPMANRMSMLENIIILCGHYKGIAEGRIRYRACREETA
jgi:tRNA (guanine37-N1)-methyltransferase